ncbi:MAG: 6-phosphogluconolactonase [Planctomycetota bacterium]|jgi:6-phosphogluconolactonase
MEIHVLPDRMQLARAAALRLTALAADAIRSRGAFTLALSGGSTPWAMLEVLATQDIDWSRVHVFQVDERVAPDGDEIRNWTHVRRSLLDRTAIPASHLHPMPVLEAPSSGAHTYASRLAAAAGTPPILDCVQLGLGDDGHTASLVPGDPILEVDDRDVAWTGEPYRGTRRMSLTFPCLDRARTVLWLVAGSGKEEMVQRLVQGDHTIPGGRVRADRAVLFADAAAGVEVRGS